MNRKEGSNYIIMGTSHATHGVRPSYINLPEMIGYNFALNGSNPEFYYKWYTQLFKKTYVKPEFIIFCIEWFLFDEKKLWRRYEQDSEYFPFHIFIDNLLDDKAYDIKMLLLNRFPFTKHKKASDLVYLVHHKPNTRFPLDEFDRGFIPYESGKHPNSVEDIKELISLKQLIFFVKLIDLLVNEGNKLIFVNLPEYGHIKKYENVISFDIFNEISNNHGIPMLNYNIDKRTDINQQRDNYSDWEHLNSKGSKEFSTVLRRDLAGILSHY
ncbi:MAG: hypothetical protein HQK75_03765 [Candidatus Magnetomorum sp.]|nr:hypothetical protein [Candidatus Magnetomorum sp.]